MTGSKPKAPAVPDITPLAPPAQLPDQAVADAGDRTTAAARIAAGQGGNGTIATSAQGLLVPPSTNKKTLTGQ